jgi:hypothetical protein
MNLIGDITLNEEFDTRYMRFRPHMTFSVKACYYAINFGGATVLGNSDIWNSLASKNVIFLLGLPFIIGLILRKGLLGKELFLSLLAPLGVSVMKTLFIYYFYVLTLL